MASTTSVAPTAETTESPIREAIPELRAGDHLARAEFERRYLAMPHLKKAELVEGVVYMPSPVRYPEHGRPHLNLAGWLATYIAATAGVDGGDNSTVRLDLDNEPQPDACLRILPECGGQATVSDDGYLEGAPELVAEVAASSASYDLHAKKKAYRRNGVPEYLVWRVLDQTIDWFVLQDGNYEPRPADADGRLRSRVFPGLWLDPAALARGDLKTVLEVLRQGLTSPEHADFVARLARTRAASS